jgi:hypothetical protein
MWPPITGYGLPTKLSFTGPMWMAHAIYCKLRVMRAWSVSFTLVLSGASAFPPVIEVTKTVR